MKKLFGKLFVISLVLTLSIGCLSIPSQAEAAPQPVNNMVLISEDIEYLSNGITLITSIYEDISINKSSATKGTPYTKSGKRTQTAKNGTTTLYSFTITGTFTVNPGVSATCTSSVPSHTIDHSDWSLSSSSASKSGNKALGTGVFKRTLLFFTVETQTLNLTLTCSTNGVLS